MGGGRGGPASLVSALLSEWRERTPASSPGCPVPRPPLAAALPSPAPRRTSSGGVPPCAADPGPRPGPRPGQRASGARGRSAPGRSQRCAAGQRRPRRWSCCLLPRPARPAPPAPRAPERRARSSSAPTPPPALQAVRAPPRLPGLYASCPTEAASSGRGPLHTMAPGRTGAGATVRARLALALALASVLSVAPATACPTKCTCSAASVDCHGLGLRAVPRGIPRNAERL